MFISFVPQTDGLIPFIRKNMSKPKKIVSYARKLGLIFSYFHITEIVNSMIVNSTCHV